MGQVLHGGATTTPAIRAAIQRSKAPLEELAARHRLNRNAVTKWRRAELSPRRADGPGPNHSWTKGFVERMNRTLKEATVQRYNYDTHRQLEDRLAGFLDAYNFARRLKTLRSLTP